MQIILILVFVTLAWLFYFYQQKLKQQLHQLDIEEQKRIQEHKKQEEIVKLMKLKEQQKKLQIELEIKKKQELFEKSILGQKEAIKYYLFNTDLLRYNLVYLYKDIICDLLWINEPFHTKFYEFLMLINDNNFMIIDKNSEVITMNIRNKYNKMQTSKSYQVFSTKDVLIFVINQTINHLARLNKYDAQNILLAIFVFALEQSVHYISRDIAINTINELLKSYPYNDNIIDISKSIKDENSNLKFVSSAFNLAFSKLNTLPYNDSEIKKPLEFPPKLPQKFLQKI